jgi:adenine-specific DNA-methyltransferase
MADRLIITSEFVPAAHAVIYQGDCMDFLRSLPDQSVQLIVTSPPYNIGKSYEKRSRLEHYIADQSEVIAQCVRVLKPEGSICWQVGNYVNKTMASSIVPLDIALYPVFAGLGLKLRNRIIWHFEHGLHCSKRFSGRYETINWFTKSDDYFFDVDPIRVPQKYPGKKYFKGPKAGQYSCNPLGKNPGDLWTIPNVKNNHVEKTDHPCQFPVELVERLVLSMTREHDWVLDPYLGVGSTAIAAIKNNRRGAGSEVLPEYAKIARERVTAVFHGTLRLRHRNQPVYDPKDAGTSLTTSPWKIRAERPTPIAQSMLFENKAQYGAGKNR